ncbi:MAG: hypothetical protein GXP32_10115 [Kiritimatiellaeota bacterium]|nr:hypothetical protein [Kiritimatiellota bacterium]
MLLTNTVRKKMAQSSSSFDTSGTEGMLDVILACTLIFILLTALIQVDSGKSQETALPDVDLTKSRKTANGASSVKRTVVSIKMNGASPRFFVDDREMSLSELKGELGKLSGIGQVALRRDKSIACEWEDKVIMLCRDSGVDRVAIMVSAD